MSTNTQRIDDIRIATPCTADWNAMTGDARSRFCGECKLNVYDISNMTASEATALLERTEGRLCVRMYRRKDGTVITRDCPVGVRARLRRAASAAGAALAAVVGLFSAVVARTVSSAYAAGDAPTFGWSGGQNANRNAPTDHPTPMMGAVAMPSTTVTVSVVDESGDAVPGAVVTLTNPKTRAAVTAQASGDGDGLYTAVGLAPGSYKLNVSADGHVSARPQTVRVAAGNPVRLDVTLEETGHVIMGGISPIPRGDASAPPDPGPSETTMNVDEP